MRRLLASALGGALVGLALIVPAPRAWGVGCSGASLIHVQAVPGTNGRGARSTSMATFDATVTCVHISSIGDRSTSGNGVFVEAGWLENPLGLIICSATSGSPIWFMFRVTSTGVAECISGSTLTAGTNHSFSAHDDNLNGMWQMNFDGSLIVTWNMGTFTTGQPVGNGERRVASDPGHVNIGGLQRMDATASWVNWTNTFVFEDTDPIYNACTASFPTRLQVTSTC